MENSKLSEDKTLDRVTDQSAADIETYNVETYDAETGEQVQSPIVNIIDPPLEEPFREKPSKPTKSGLNLCCSRLCASNFEHSQLTSKSADKSMVVLTDAKDAVNIRGQWGSRIEFLLSCIGFAVGLGNVWRFPIRVYESGGGAFLIPYIIFCILLGTPLIMLEMGLGQFSSKGPTQAFKMVPIFFAIGWCMVLVSACILIYYGVIIAWSYFFLFGCFDPSLPWVRCNHAFNTDKCISSISKVKSVANISSIAATQEYWDYYVTGFRKTTGEYYTMNESPGLPQWHLSLCLILVWFIAAISLMFGVKVSGKIVYFTALFPYVAIIALIILGCTLPGAMHGIRYYLYPDFNIMIQPKTLLGCIEQLFFSTSIGMGGMITLSSFNNFHDNVYRDALIVVVMDFVTSLIAGFAVFPILGYMAHISGRPIEKVVTGGAGLFFVTYPSALATLPGANFWTFLFMLMAITLGMDSQFAMLETITTALGDTFLFFRKTVWHKASCVIGLCFLFFLLGLLIVTPGGMFWFTILDGRVSTYALPFNVFIESLIIGSVYGMRQFRIDMRMMMGFSLSWVWLIFMGVVSPIIIFCILIASIVKFAPLSEGDGRIPMWAEVIGLILLAIVIIPFFIGIIYETINIKKLNPDLETKLFMKQLVTPPIKWGPASKSKWLCSKSYSQKLLLFKDDPAFLHSFENAASLENLVQVVSSSSVN